MPGHRWQAHEFEALQWLFEKRNQRHYEALRRGEQLGRGSWSWAVIAKKMNRVAARDEWEDSRVYTALNCYTAWRKRQKLFEGSSPNILEHVQLPPGPLENPDQQQPLEQDILPAPARFAETSDKQVSPDQVHLTQYPSITTAPRQRAHNETELTPTPSPMSRQQVIPAADPPPQPQYLALPLPPQLSSEDAIVFNLSNNLNPDPPYHWTSAERGVLKEVYLLSGIGFADNYIPGRRKGLWSWKMVATEMNKRARGAPWDVARTYTDASCHQKAKYYKAEWDDPRNIRPAGASCAPMRDE